MRFAHVFSQASAFSHHNALLPPRARLVCSRPDSPSKRPPAPRPHKPGYQWDDAGGYCGSWAVQRATLAKGAYISQQQVRDHTSPGGGHDNEILSTNIVEALTNLKLSFEGFDFQTTPLPQQPAYVMLCLSVCVLCVCVVVCACKCKCV